MPTPPPKHTPCPSSPFSNSELQVRGLTKRLKTMEEELESKQGRLSSLEATHRASLDSIERLRAELGTPLESDLTDEEQETVQTLTAETTELKKELITIAQRVSGGC